MYFQTIILAALSAGALANDVGNVYLTAFSDPYCNGTAGGNNVTISAPVPTQANVASKATCVNYAPEHGQNISLVHYDFTNVSFIMEFFNETDCHHTNRVGFFEGMFADRCLQMNEITPGTDNFHSNGDDWQSVRLYFEIMS